MTRSDLIAAGGQHIRTLHVNENGMTTNHSMCVEVVMVMGRYEAEERVTSMCYDKGCHVMAITTAGRAISERERMEANQPREEVEREERKCAGEGCRGRGGGHD